MESLENVKKGVFSGDTLTKLFLKDPLFPPTFGQLISVGEQTGQLDEMFGSVANIMSLNLILLLITFQV